MGYCVLLVFESWFEEVAEGIDNKELLKDKLEGNEDAYDEDMDSSAGSSRFSESSYVEWVKSTLLPNSTNEGQDNPHAKEEKLFSS